MRWRRGRLGPNTGANHRGSKAAGPGGHSRENLPNRVRGPRDHRGQSQGKDPRDSSREDLPNRVRGPLDSRGQSQGRGPQDHSRGPMENRGQSKGRDSRDSRGPSKAKVPQDRDHPVRAKNRGAPSSRSLALLHKAPGSPGPSHMVQV